ncbi:hypothetical protein B0T25DRAFT_456419 [Lasiosphaeria hispida]|uniref:COP9 signalosome complex subunit 6 n=1 Tax=Lasiosphaeria hispida TaxID=260671 RepID=A0AAJ0HH66_9PEZI|nr:hypothetical protein B0T25DRAFT_456419 [Lasiosphaeria hispida]
MADQLVNDLLSTQKSSDSGLQVALHPLPILEISDYITRGSQRGQKGAIVGALLGQQNGREITVEHSFSCKSEKNAQGFYELDEAWFLARLEQMKLVQKAPPLELVGWYSLVPKTGPSPVHLPIHKQIIAQNESAILLGFHVEGVLHPVAGDPLPLTIYESNMEADDSSKEDAGSEDKEMKDSEAPVKTSLKFRELPYTTETGEAEMIAMQFIREGGAHATIVDDAEKRILEQFDKKVAVDDGKGKRRAVSQQESKSKAAEAATATPSSPTDKDANLTKAEAEYMSALQAKFNAIKMMKSRVDLIVAYLSQLPPDFVAGKLTTPAAAELARASGGTYTVPSNNILRQIQALVTNIELATPAHQETLEKEILQETNDVNLVSLIANLLSSANEVREAAKKFAVVEAAKSQRSRPLPNFDTSLISEYSRGIELI